jgi:hypothetical protein
MPPTNEPTKPRTYEEWLALTDEQREAVLMSWNAYAREGIAFPYIAAGRLALVSETPVLDVRVGTYHCGEYLLHAYVADEAVASLPRMLEQKFEGFRVVWLPASQLGAGRAAVQDNR